MITERDIVFLAVKQQMEHAVNEMRSELDKQMFKDSSFLNTVISYKPIPKYKIYWGQIKNYFFTLWLAIKGTELEEPNDDNY